MKKLKKAAKQTGIRQIAIAGGVSANSGLREALTKMGEKEGWRLCNDINLLGDLFGVTTAIDRMSRSKGGRGGIVVNVASILGLFNG